MAYENTTVDVTKSQGEIRKILTRFGAREFQFGEGTGDDDRRWAGVTFKHAGHMVMIQAPLKEIDQQAVSNKHRRARTKSRDEVEQEFVEQENRRIWRVLHWTLKARMVAVEEEVEEFEQAFLAHLVDPTTGATLWSHMKPSIEQGALRIGGGGMLAIGAGNE